MNQRSTKSDFLNITVVQEFVDYFSRLLPVWRVSYHSQHRRLKNRNIVLCGVQQALAKYSWPSEFGCPDDMRIGSSVYAKGERVVTDDWPSTYATLNALRTELKTAIQFSEDHKVLVWSGCILKWGMGSRGAAAKEFLRSKRSVAKYLADVDELIRADDLTKITADSVPSYNSGLSKIHSLASQTGMLVIFDSRVAVALGTAINSFLAKQKHKSIPSCLAVGRSGERKRSPTVLVNGENQPVLARDYRWLKSQIKASWILEAALKRNIQIFNGPIEHRLHCLEAALFMIGPQPEAVRTGLCELN